MICTKCKGSLFMKIYDSKCCKRLYCEECVDLLIKQESLFCWNNKNELNFDSMIMKSSSSSSKSINIDWSFSNKESEYEEEGKKEEKRRDNGENEKAVNSIESVKIGEMENDDNSIEEITLAQEENVSENEQEKKGDIQEKKGDKQETKSDGQDKKVDEQEDIRENDKEKDKEEESPFDDYIELLELDYIRQLKEAEQNPIVRITYSLNNIYDYDIKNAKIPYQEFLTKIRQNNETK